MAAPSTLSVGSRVTVTLGFVPTGNPLNPVSQVPLTVPPSGGTTPAPTFGVGCEVPGLVTSQGTPLPGMCQVVNGSAPDFAGSSAVIHDLAGKPWLITMGLFQTSWVSAGSLATQRRWNFVDLTF